MDAMDRRPIIGIKSGTFTILHPGHIWMLDICKEHCDYLIVLTNSDDYIKRKKGVVPIDLQGRMSILRALKQVDRVDTFPEDTEDRWIQEYKKELLEIFPDAKLIVFHSIETYGKDHIPAADVADEIVYIPRMAGSTTEIFNVIMENKNAD